MTKSNFHSIFANIQGGKGGLCTPSIFWIFWYSWDFLVLLGFFLYPLEFNRTPKILNQARRGAFFGIPNPLQSTENLGSTKKISGVREESQEYKIGLFLLANIFIKNNEKEVYFYLLLLLLSYL